MSFSQEIAKIVGNNLRRFSVEHGSISAVCRSARVNRQQFNKYLAGENVPSVQTLLRLAQALGKNLDDMVKIDTMQIPMDNRCNVMDPRGAIKGLDALLDSALEPGSSRGGETRMCLGHFLEVSRYGNKGDSFLVSLSRFWKEHLGNFYVRSNNIGLPDGAVCQPRYNGHFYESDGRICVYYVNGSARGGISSQYLVPDPHWDRCFVGIKAGHQFSGNHLPESSPIFLKYIGKTCEEADVMAETGVFHRDDLKGEIEEIVSSRIFEAQFEDLPNRLSS